MSFVLNVLVVLPVALSNSGKGRNRERGIGVDSICKCSILPGTVAMTQLPATDMKFRQVVDIRTLTVNTSKDYMTALHNYLVRDHKNYYPKTDLSWNK